MRGHWCRKCRASPNCGNVTRLTKAKPRFLFRMHCIAAMPKRYKLAAIAVGICALVWLYARQKKKVAPTPGPKSPFSRKAIGVWVDGPSAYPCPPGVVGIEPKADFCILPRAEAEQKCVPPCVGFIEPTPGTPNSDWWGKQYPGAVILVKDTPGARQDPSGVFWQRTSA
jgi:hypothetical protein